MTTRESWNSEQFRAALELVQELHTRDYSPMRTAEVLAARLATLLGARDRLRACELGLWLPEVWAGCSRWTSYALVGWPAGLGDDQAPGTSVAAGEAPHIRALVDRCPAGACATELRDILVNDLAWNSTALSRNSLTPASMGIASRDVLVSVFVPAGGAAGSASFRGAGCIQLFASPSRAGTSSPHGFDERDRELLHALHQALGSWLWNRLGAWKFQGDTDDAAGSGGSDASDALPVSDHIKVPDSVSAAICALTPAQRAVLPHLLNGATEAEIARRIFRSRYTVHDHARAIYAALGVRNRVELVLKLTGGGAGARGNVPVGVVSPIAPAQSAIPAPVTIRSIDAPPSPQSAPRGAQ